jgi:hypothetical protein
MNKTLFKTYVRYVLSEMPHVDVESANIRLRAKTRILLIDFRIEHLPISLDEKQNLMRAFKKSGFIAKIDGVPFVFVDDEPSVRRPTERDLRVLPHLPDTWISNAEFVEE